MYDPLSDKLFNKTIIVNFKNKAFFPRALVSKSFKYDPQLKLIKKVSINLKTEDEIFSEKPIQ